MKVAVNGSVILISSEPQGWWNLALNQRDFCSGGSAVKVSDRSIVQLTDHGSSLISIHIQTKEGVKSESSQSHLAAQR